MGDAHEIHLEDWVKQADKPAQPFREAIHIVLASITSSQELQSRLVMKGGLLMAIRYSSTRFTKDIDFSTHDTYREGDEDKLVALLGQQIDIAASKLNYDTTCLVQRFRIQPKRPDKTFPSLALSVGYCARSDQKAFERLQARQSPQVVQIDYSFNEAVLDIDIVKFEDGGELRAYSFANFVAEKMRSLLQQPIRMRNRRQDAYDLHLLLTTFASHTAAEREKVFTLLQASCSARDIAANVDSMSAELVKRMAAAEYQSLRTDVKGDLPDFEEAFGTVERYYRLLPWARRIP